MRTSLSILLLLAAELTHAQWLPEVQLSSSPSPWDASTSANNGRGIASSGSTLHVAWTDSRDANYEIYYKRSTDDGLTWGPDTRLTSAAFNSYSPCVAASASAVHVVWTDERNGNQEIYYKRSLDGGASWEADVRLTNDAAISETPSLAVSGGSVQIVWRDQRDGNYEIYHKRSPDGGTTWSADNRITNEPANQQYPTVAIGGTVVHVAWTGFQTVGDIFYTRSIDLGSTWTPEIQLTTSTVWSIYPCIAASGNDVHAVWTDLRDFTNEIYYDHSSDAGLTWSTDTPLTTDPADSMYPTVVVSGPVLNIAWHDERDGNWEIYNKRSIDNGATWSADDRLTNDTGASDFASICAAGNALYLIFTDDRAGEDQIFCASDPIGNVVGIAELANDGPLLLIAPNPVDRFFTLECDMTLLSGSTITVHDMTGREMPVTFTIRSGDAMADTAGLSPGAYTITVRTGEGEATARFVKE